MKKIFVGRQYYLDKFDQFLISESFQPKDRILLLQGDEGIGKTALLQAMAKRAANQNHILAFGNLYHDQSDFFSQIYPIIAQIRLKQRLKKVGNTSDWLKFGLIGFTTAVGVTVGGPFAALFSGASALATLEIDIKKVRKGHEASGLNAWNLVQIFLDVLSKRAGKMIGSDRIIIFLDPEKLTPRDMIPMLKQMVERLPSRVRFVIAQRNNDCLIGAFEQGELKDVCKPPLKLGFLQKDEETEFINSYDPNDALGTEVKQRLTDKYKGWPLLLSLAVEDLLGLKRDIKETDVQDLPSDIDAFWKKRYKNIKDENALKVLHIACLLPHPYPKGKLAEFCKLSHITMEGVLNNSELRAILSRVDFRNTLSPVLLEACPYPKHLTAKDYVKSRLSQYEELKHQLLTDIIEKYQTLVGDDLYRPDIDPDALANLLPMLLEDKQTDEYLSAHDRLTPVKIRYGLLDSSLKNLRIALSIHKKLGSKEGMATQYGNMGIVYRIRGDLDKALEMYQKSLEIHKELGSKEGMASDYGNTGIVCNIRGDLDKAFEMYQKSLEIHKELGSKEGMANQYGNMGIVYHIRGDLDKALVMYQKSLELNKDLDSKKGMANQYGNMGNVYRTRGDMDKAFEMYQKSLEINKELGSKEGMATQYGNMGNVYQIRGDLDKAFEMYQKSLEINKELGHKEGMATQYGNMGNVYQIRGDLDKALEMYQKALEINKELGSKKGMANQYGNMGIVYKIRGDLDKALVMYQKSLELNKELGHKEGVANQYGNMGNVYQIHGDLDKARKVWKESLRLFSQIDISDRIEIIEKWLNELDQRDSN